MKDTQQAQEPDPQRDLTEEQMLAVADFCDCMGSVQPHRAIQYIFYTKCFWGATRLPMGQFVLSTAN